MPESADFERWPDPGPLSAWLRATFGVDPDLSDHAVWESSSGALWIASSEVVLPALGVVSALGLLASRVPLHRGQLSTPFMRRFCAGATINVCELADASAFLSGGVLAWSDPWPDGQRVVISSGRVLGRGRTRAGSLECELPKSLRVLGEDAPGTCPDPLLE